MPATSLGLGCELPLALGGVGAALVAAGLYAAVGGGRGFASRRRASAKGQRLGRFHGLTHPCQR